MGKTVTHCDRRLREPRPRKDFANASGLSGKVLSFMCRGPLGNSAPADVLPRCECCLLPAFKVLHNHANRNLFQGRHFPTSAGILFGLGLGGFFDGIVLHQLLQWHHMLSSWYPVNSIENLELNTSWDGIFHSSTYLFVVGRVYSSSGAPRTAATSIGRLSFSSAAC